MSTSPFSNARFEYDGDNLYYLPETLLDEIETFAPKFLIGSRGTGKTTFLRALWWKERLNNPFLLDALSGRNLFGDYIGLYIKLPTIQIGAFSAWKTDAPVEEKAQFFSLYLDMLACQQAVEAIHELAKADKLNLSVQAEYNLTSQIISDYRLSLFSDLDGQTDVSLKSIEKHIWSYHVRLTKQVKEQASPDMIRNAFPEMGFGGFGRYFFEHLKNIPELKDVHFKICLDECESLSHEQLLTLNSMIRTTEAHVSFIAAFVREPYDMNETYITGLTLQKADREIIPLDAYAEDDNRFESLVDGVATVRIRKALSKQNVKFKTRDVLGSLNLNRLLETRLNSSESNKKVKDLLDLAKTYAETDFYKEQKTGQEKTDDTLPIYNAYLCSKLDLEIPTKTMSSQKRRNQESRQMRKKMVCAYLSICHEYKMDVWYAYAEMFLQTCDSCLRDYLWQMQALYEDSGRSLNDFISKRVSEKVQNTALKRASRQKRDSIIVQDKIRSPEKTERLIDSLAKITHFLQTTSSDNQHLRSSERGRFCLAISQVLGEPRNIIIKLIEDAGDAGFLKIISKDAQRIIFRVHTSLAPEYEFSYRGAYYDTPLELSPIYELIEDDDVSSRSKRAEELSTKISGQRYSEPLFEGKDVWSG